MSDIALNPDTGDLDLTAGDVGLVTGPEAIRQRLELRLTIAKEEWFLDTNFGTDYYGKILGKKRLNEVDSELLRVILSTPGVIKLLEPITYEFEDRILRATFSALIEEEEEITLTVTL